MNIYAFSCFSSRALGENLPDFDAYWPKTVGETVVYSSGAHVFEVTLTEEYVRSGYIRRDLLLRTVSELHTSKHEYSSLFLFICKISAKKV